MSASAQWQDRVVPAKLSFLAIYNPTLGPTDETFPDQLVYWYSRAANETRASHKKAAANSKGKARTREHELREEENERLRQIGLAQGMVDFARTFSNGQPVDSVETEKSRIVLKELEHGWWILASIDLTRLPSAAPTQSLKPTKGSAIDPSTYGVEYSSREVSPPALLIEQLVQAHAVYLLHHGASLDELFVKLSRDRFCSTLARYWSRFARSWDVLLHGNPAVDVLSGLKLASGGELGFGVGEEEWGSGEREVLEDLVNRTEGLVDLVVARYGEPAPKESGTKSSIPEAEALPWMGSGNRPLASDGIFFSGVNAVSRTSLRDVSLWMQQVYTQGEFAYGVRDNPNRERRKRRRRNPPESNGSASGPRSQDGNDARELRKNALENAAAKQEQPVTVDPKLLPKDHRPQVHDRVASHDHATNEALPQVASHPGIPPPIVSAAEQALNKATQRASSRPPPRPKEEADSGTTMGIPDQYMHVMTFGLSYLAKSYTKKQPEPTRSSSIDSDKTLLPPARSRNTQKNKDEDASTNEDDELMMTQVDPIPDGAALEARFAQQIRLENTGSFVIGLKGDLDREADSGELSLAEESSRESEGGSRMVLRTLQVHMVPDEQTYANEVDDDLHDQDNSKQSKSTNSTTRNMKRLQVLVYVHRPFMYCFLFEQRTSSLSYSSFYKTLHHNLVPIHKPLLSSTSVEKVAQRIESSHIDASGTASQTSVGSNRLPSKPTEATPIFDLLYDPARLTVHTSIPNIPDPGTPAAEGIIPNTSRTSSAPLTRLEALNVHSQILSTIANTSSQKNELERTSKTTRGWWIVWMRLPPSSDTTTSKDEDSKTARQVDDAASTNPVQDESIKSSHSTAGHAHTVEPPPPDMRRIAFLVRKANDSNAQVKASTGSRMASGMWSTLALRSNPTSEDKTGGASSGWGPAALAGGIGVDARKYVEGLLSLNR